MEQASGKAALPSRGSNLGCRQFELLDFLESADQEVALDHYSHQGGGWLKGKSSEFGVFVEKNSEKIGFFRSLLLNRTTDGGYSQGIIKIRGLVGPVVNEHRYPAAGQHVAEFTGRSAGKEKQAAKVLDIPVGTAKSRLHRGLEALRESMRAEPEAGIPVRERTA